MTVISSFLVNNYPVLIGDIITSGDEVTGEACNIPTIGSSQQIFPEGSGFVINGVVQKTCCLNQNIAIGFAGNGIAAKHVLNELEKLCNQKKELSFKDIYKYFTVEIDPWCKDKLQIIGFIKDSKGIQPFHYNVNRFESKHFGEVKLAGSGTYGLKEIIESLEPSPSTSKVNPLEFAVASTLGLINVLVGNEIVTGNNLLEYYGGGYEIITLINGKFKKIQNVSYLLWHVFISNNGNIQINIPKVVLKIYYVKDLLFIRKILLETKGEVVCVKEEALNVISSISKNIIDEKEIMKHVPSSFNSPFTCNYFLIESEYGSRNILSRIHYTGSKNYPFNVVESKDRFDCYVNNEFIKSVALNISRNHQKHERKHERGRR